MLDYLKSHYGVSSYFIVPNYHPAAILLFLKSYVSALFFPKQGSLIMIQSVYSKRLYANALKLLVYFRKDISCYDLDDADYLRYSPETIYYFLRNCGVVSLGSSELVKNLSFLNNNSIMITCPIPDLSIVKKKKNEVLTIGWIGDFTSGHKESLMTLFFPALQELSFPINLVMLGVTRNAEYESLNDYLKMLDHVKVEIPRDIDWQDEISLQHKIATFDIGIATLLDTEFYRSKSAFKLKQYLNNGVPVLSSDVAENNVFVDHGKNGFLCTRPDDFKKRIIEFNNMNQSEYQVFSDNARNTVKRFDMRNFCEELIEIIKQK